MFGSPFRCCCCAPADLFFIAMRRDPTSAASPRLLSSMRLPLQTFEAALAAILPDRVLDEPREGLWKARVELPGIDPPGDGLNDKCAATGPVAGHAIQVVRVEPGQDAGPVQKVVHQRVDGDHAAADLDPEDHLFGSAERK